MMRLLAHVALLGAMLASGPAAGQELGRLFFTPEQRTALDARRKARVPDKPAASVVESAVTRVDGVVSRGGGKSTVWVNGEPIPEGAQPEGLRVRARKSDSSRVTMEQGAADTLVDLKIGQSFDSATGEVKDVMRSGEVKVNTRGTKSGR